MHQMVNMNLQKNIKVNDILKCYVLNNSYNICKENMLEIYL